MESDLKNAIINRRSYYSITNQSPVSDLEIKEILTTAVKYVPSGYNMQSARLVLLLKEHHQKLWQIVMETLRKIVPPENFERTEKKINGSFASGYGTILYFEDEESIESLQQKFPTYADNFPTWSMQASGMIQFAVWTMLENVGFGASLQHYNPLIDDAVKEEWHLSPKWKLVAQMPFGTPSAQPNNKVIKPVEERLFIFD